MLCTLQSTSNLSLSFLSPVVTEKKVTNYNEYERRNGDLMIQEIYLCSDSIRSLPLSISLVTVRARYWQLTERFPFPLHAQEVLRCRATAATRGEICCLPAPPVVSAHMCHLHPTVCPVASYSSRVLLSSMESVCRRLLLAFRHGTSSISRRRYFMATIRSSWCVTSDWLVSNESCVC